MKKAGCYQLCLGVQSIDPWVRREIFHRPGSNDQIVRAIKLCRDNNIRVVVDNIIGYPQESKDSLSEISRFYSEHRPDRICIFWLVYYPRTAIVDIAQEAGVLTREEIERLEEEPYDTANTLYNRAHLNQKKRDYLFLVLWEIPDLIPNRFQKYVMVQIRKRLYRPHKSILLHYSHQYLLKYW